MVSVMDGFDHLITSHMKLEVMNVQHGMKKEKKKNGLV